MFRTLTVSLFLLLFVVAAWAAKTDLSTGDACSGVGCADEEIHVELPDNAPPEDTPVSIPDTESACESIARRVYSLCLATPNSGQQDCQQALDDALGNCLTLATGEKETEDDVITDSINTRDCTAYPFDRTSAQLGTPNSDDQFSNGLYRVPYENGTEVHVSFDFDHHNGDSGKTDMSGRGGRPYRIVAADSGCIMYLEDSRYKNQHPWLHPEPCTNNFLWIKHENGEWSKYSHMKQHSSSKMAGLKVGDYVVKGTYLGDQGSVGCSGSPHLHFEIVVPSSNNPGVNGRSGGINMWRLAQARRPFICGITDKTLRNKKNYIAVVGPGSIPPNTSEDIRTGMPLHNYRCMLRQAILGGFQPAWVDFFANEKETDVNLVLVPSSNGWATRSGLTDKEMQETMESMSVAGFRLQQLESYQDGKLLYAGLWTKTNGAAQKFYLGASDKQHAELVDEYKALGFRPVNISVVRKSGLKYTSLWQRGEGSWALRSKLTIQEYRDLAVEKSNSGVKVVYLNAFVDKSTPYLSVIWSGDVEGKVKRKTDLGKKDMDLQRDLARKAGLATKAMTGYNIDGKTRYIAVFGE